MYLQSIRINNFRLFEKFELEFNQGLNLLIGENDSGKTALIDAIRYVLGAYSSDNLYIDETDFHKGSSELSIELKFSDLNDYAHIFLEYLTYENGEYNLYIYFTAKITGKEKRGYPEIKIDIKSGKSGIGIQIEKEIRDFLMTTYLKPLRDAECELSSGRKSRLAQILASSKDIKNAKLDIIKPFDNANSEILTDGDTAIKKTATHIKDEYFYKLIFEQDKNTLIPHIDIIEKNANDDKKLRKILEMLSLSITQDRYKHGLGYNNLLFIATELILLNQENSTSEQFSLLMIEEPEAHLHPQLQMKLLDFVKTKTQSVSDNIQCILTTHSPNIASKASPQDIIMMNNGQAFSMRDNERLLEEENYKFLEKFLDVTKANLFFARGIILVEGLAEQILIPTIAKLLGYPLEDYGISVIAVNGTSWEHFARIFLSKDENKPHPMKIAILRDLDLRPVEAEKKDGNVFGFINRTEENEWWWIDVPDGKQTERRKQDLKKDLDKQNVKIFISDEWTFEYCLADKLKDECKDALKKCFIKKSKLSDIENTFATNELYRIYLMKNIAKSEFAYHLSEILSEKYKNDKEGLKSKLPNYITQALEYIVGME